EEAEQALDTATELYRSCGDASQAARILVKRGFVYYEAGQPERAVEVTRQALPSIDGARDPRLLLCAQHNLVWFLEQAGRLEEARQLLDQVQSLYDQFGDPGTQLRRQWVVGRIARGLGERERAEQALTATRLGFLSQGLGFDSALVGLDLALLYIELGRPNEVKRLAEEMVPIFLMQDIHREATAALLLFQEAARQEAATVPMVAQLIAYLERVRKGSKDLVS
nr:hypothetical protein [Thermoanaerobaculia bacterium]